MLQTQIAMTPSGSYRDALESHLRETRKNENRTTILSRITRLRGDEPWPGYDELSVDEIRAALDEGDEDRVKRVRSYEHSHKNRSGVIDVAERELVKA